MENITNVDDKIIKGTYQNFYGNQMIPDDYDLNNLDSSKYLINQMFTDYADEWEKKFPKLPKLPKFPLFGLFASIRSVLSRFWCCLAEAGILPRE